MVTSVCGWVVALSSLERVAGRFLFWSELLFVVEGEGRVPHLVACQHHLAFVGESLMGGRVDVDPRVCMCLLYIQWVIL
jgi:hypothetical protein